MADHVEFRPVRGWADAFRLRSVRNEMGPYMTRRTRRIGLLEQARWFRDNYRPMLSVGVGVAELVLVNGRVAGYGMVFIGESPDWPAEARPKGWWVSGGLLQPYRGGGLGRLLFARLSAMAATAGGGRVLLEVRAENAVALGLYRSLGYGELAHAARPGVGGVLLMERLPEEQSARSANLRREA